MVIGQGEFPEAYFAPTDFGPGAGTPPGSCQNSSIANTQLPYCLQLNVNMHNNMVTYNSSTGDELFTGTPAGAGGVSICTGSDYYMFNYNWVCGNMSSGDGGGVGQLGFSYNGDIEHNAIILNQSTNCFVIDYSTQNNRRNPNQKRPQPSNRIHFGAVPDVAAPWWSSKD